MNKTRLIIPLLFLALFLTVSSCGKKGPPFVPRKEFSVKIVDLKGEWVKGDLFLKGDIHRPMEPEKAVGPVKGCRVYYARYTLEDSPCAGCPIEYQGYYELGPEVITAEGFFCKVPGEIKRQISFFKVHLTGPEGVVGPPSNRVRVVMEVTSQ